MLLARCVDAPKAHGTAQGDGQHGQHHQRGQEAAHKVESAEQATHPLLRQRHHQVEREQAVSKGVRQNQDGGVATDHAGVRETLNFFVALSWLSWRFVRHDTTPDARELQSGEEVERLTDSGVISRDAGVRETLNFFAALELSRIGRGIVTYEPPRQPGQGDEEVERLTDSGVISRDAAILVLAYAFGYSLLAFDLMMSLAQKWVSSLFGAFYFMGSFLAALMMLAVLAITLRRAMGLGGIYTSRQQHDLGKLCFGFTVFWAYLMWSQFLVIWYGNLPEETYFIFYRLTGAWRPVGVAVFL